MVSLVTRLHEKWIVHGGVGQTNFLWAQDGSLLLCDFDMAFYLDGRTSQWEAGCDLRYVS